MFRRKLVADLALVSAVFVLAAGLVVALRTYQGCIDPAFVDFQLRSKTLASRIEDGIRSKNLANGQDLSAELRAIVKTFPKTDCTPAASARLHSQLDRLASKIDLNIFDRQSKSMAIEDLVSKKTRIELKLSSNLSPIQKVFYEKKLKNLNAHEMELLETGGLSYWQRRKLNADLDMLESQLSSRSQVISKISSL